MILSLFDQTRKNETSSYGEAVRLSNELRSRTESSYIDGLGGLVKIPAKIGFNCETADYIEFTTWLNNPAIKKSPSLFWFVIRIMAWRFPTKHAEIKASLSVNRQFEFDLILSQMKKESEWVGTVGYSGMVRLDKSLTNPRNRIIKGNNDDYRIVRK